MEDDHTGMRLWWLFLDGGNEIVVIIFGWRNWVKGSSLQTNAIVLTNIAEHSKSLILGGISIVPSFTILPLSLTN